MDVTKVLKGDVQESSLKISQAVAALKPKFAYQK